MSNIIDKYLLFRLRTKQDPEAFATLYDRYVEAIYRFSILKLSSKEEAEDVTSETFTRAWQYIQERNEITHFRALLYRIARNLIADRYRRAKPIISLEAITSVTFESDMASESVEGKFMGDKGRASVVIEAQAEASLIISKLERLKEDYRDVLTLRLVDDLPFSVIAGILEKPVGTVRVLFHRAMKALEKIDSLS